MSWIPNVFRRSRIYNDLAEEMRLHVEERTEQLMREGMSRKEAGQAARRAFGNRTVMEERSREVWQWPTLESIWADLRFAFRQLRRFPGFTLTAVLTLALGIGANAVVFSLVDALLFKPLNVPDGQNLYTIQHAKEGFPGQSYPDYLDLRDRSHSFDGMLACEISTAGLDTDGTPAPVWLYTASGNYFDVLRVQPYLGRFFHATDERGPNSAPYIVLSYDYWATHLQSDRGAVGRVVRLNKHPYTILGVAPKDFRGTELFYAPDLWAPIVNQQEIEGSSNLDARGNRGRWLVARLKPGITPAQATADVNSVASWLAKTYPNDDEGIQFSLARPGLAGDMLGRPVHAFVAGLMLLSGLILLAACANLGSLFSARAEDRSREVALRLALGSSRMRILRQLLTEAVLVSLAGGAAGLAGSFALLRALGAWQPVPDKPIRLAVSPDAHTCIFALLLALASALLFGMVPVRQVLRSSPYQGMRNAAAGVFGQRRITLRDLLLAAQIAVCAVLVTSSLVAVRGMLRSLTSNFGFVPQNTLQVETDLTMSGYSGDQTAAVQRRMLDAVANIPGVTAAAYADRIPLNLGWSTNAVFRDSATDYKMANAATEAMEYFVSPGYFHTAQTTILQGREFAWNDGKDTPKVAIVNQEFARTIFGSESKAMGSFFKIWNGTRLQVVGIAIDGKYATLSESPKPAMFLPILQSPSSRTFLLVRSNHSVQDLAADVQRALHQVDAGMPLTINTWERELGTALFAARAASIALGVLGVLGAMLAITGIFGMAAYSVSKRLRELGIRVALGARRTQVLGAALGRVLRLLTIGSAMGILLGAGATKLLSFIVYQATPRDPLVLAGVVVTMVLVGLVAAWIPAQRALAADPLILLREE
jgi:macrolide transport system ATP-binding/permease protein